MTMIRDSAGLLVFGLALAACGDREVKRDAADQSAPATASAAKPKKVGEIKVNAPEAVKYDPDQDLWFVTSFGEGDPSPLGKDNNGTISRYKADGTPDSLGFIAGGRS